MAKTIKNQPKRTEEEQKNSDSEAKREKHNRKMMENQGFEAPRS